MGCLTEEFQQKNVFLHRKNPLSLSDCHDRYMKTKPVETHFPIMIIRIEIIFLSVKRQAIFNSLSSYVFRYFSIGFPTETILLLGFHPRGNHGFQ